MPDVRRPIGRPPPIVVAPTRAAPVPARPSPPAAPPRAPDPAPVRVPRGAAPGLPPIEIDVRPPSAPLRGDVVDVVPDPARMSAREMVEAIRAHTREIQTRFHAIGTMLRALDVRARVEELGYRTFEEMLEGEGLGSKMQAVRLRTAAVLPAEIALPLGLNKSYELVRWARAVEHAADDDAVVRVVRGTRSISGVPLASITVGVLRRAISESDPAAVAARNARRDAVREAASQLRRSLRRSKIAARVSVDEDEDGSVSISVRLDEPSARALAAEIDDA